MSSPAINALLDLPEYTRRNRIEHIHGMYFGIRWIDKLIRYFDSETTAQSVIYPVTLWLDGRPRRGELEVRRDGSHAVRLAS